MKKIGLIILSILLLFLIIFLIIYNKEDEKPFNLVELSKNNQIVNRTKTTYYDTIVSVGLDAMDIRNVPVIIIELTEQTKKQFEGSLKAHIRYHEGVYYLFIGNEKRFDAIQIIAHEIIHINQYNTKQLIFDGEMITWEGQPFGLNDLEYNDRPWEKDAFDKQGDLTARINILLYQ